jgi:hypothetical protein
MAIASTHMCRGLCAPRAVSLNLTPKYRRSKRCRRRRCMPVGLKIISQRRRAADDGGAQRQMITFILRGQCKLALARGSRHRPRKTSRSRPTVFPAARIAARRRAAVIVRGPQPSAYLRKCAHLPPNTSGHRSSPSGRRGRGKRRRSGRARGRP